MTLINLTVLADALGTAAPIDAVLEAEATSARTAGAEARTPQKIVVPITAGAPTAPLNLEGTGVGWCWKLVLMVPATGFRVTRFVQVPASGTVTWEDLVDVNPLTLKVLPDAVPAWKAVMDDLLAARDAAVLAESAAGAARDDAVAAKDLAISTVADVALTADTALTNAALAQAKADAAFPNGGSLGDIDLNTLKTHGIYRQGATARATLANNYPTANSLWIVEVFPLPWEYGNATVQKLTAVASSADMRGIYQRRLSAEATNTWTTWRFIPSQRIDNTAGRAIYTWDDTQNRETLVKGDTGWRMVIEAGDIPSMPNLIAYIRRVGSTVHFHTAETISGGTASGATILHSAVSGFRPTILRGSAPTISVVPVADASASFVPNASLYLSAISPFNITMKAVAGARHYAQLIYTTNDPWPTVLPGVAAGAIPHN